MGFREPRACNAAMSTGVAHQAMADFSDATVLRKFGDVPDDLSAL
jgi:hypothetical protein